MKTVCFIANTRTTCNFITDQLMRFLGDYIRIKTWCLEESPVTSFYLDSDIFVVSNHDALARIESHLPEDRPILVADRTLDVNNLEKLIQLEPYSKAIVVGTSEDTARMIGKMIQNIGFDNLNLIPYCHNTTESIPNDYQIALTSGMAHLVPPEIATIIDLGGYGLDLSTFGEVIKKLNLPMTIMNEVSQYYIKTILNFTKQIDSIARKNEDLKRNLEVILATTKEVIVAVNELFEITFFSFEAEQIFQVDGSTALGRNLNTLCAQIDLSPCIKNSESIFNEIIQINNINCIMTAHPIVGENGKVNGAVCTMRRVKEVQEMEKEVRKGLKKKGNIAKYSFDSIIGESTEFKKMISKARKFSRTDLTILLQGESGTGKELLAQAIHNYSMRSNNPFVAINFAALPESLLESELFGYEDGAFTGAKKGGKPGLFEIAHTGTIFLDEMGDASLDVQKRLLRVLEEKGIRRVGGNALIPINTRIIVATNQNLEELVRQGKFRSDLFYRFCTLPIYVIPLRDRPDDIITLMNYFIEKYARTCLEFDPELKEFLVNYKWPGNIRELENITKYICATKGNSKIAKLEHLPDYIIVKTQEANSPPSRIEESNDEKKREPIIMQEAEMYGRVVNELHRENILEPILLILNEMQQLATLSRNIGRYELLKRLRTIDDGIQEHKLRNWMKTLNNMGFIHSGIKREGSRITERGEVFIKYVNDNNKKVKSFGKL